MLASIPMVAKINVESVCRVRVESMISSSSQETGEGGDDQRPTVLNDGDTSELHASLQDKAEKHSPQILRDGEDLSPSVLGESSLLFNGELELVDLGLNEDVVDVPMCVEPSKRLDGVVVTANFAEPAA